MLTIKDVQNLIVLATSSNPDGQRTDPDLMATFYKVKAATRRPKRGHIIVPKFTITAD